MIARCPSLTRTPSSKAEKLGQSLNCHSNLYLALSHATISRGLMKFSYLWCEKGSEKTAWGRNMARLPSVS